MSGVSSEGLRTTEQPQARAGATFQAAVCNGKFQGTMARDHAHRFAQGVVEVRAIHRNGLAVEFAHPAGVVVEAIGRGGDVGAGGLAEGLAGLLGDELGELVAVLQEEIADVPQDALALGGIEAAPGFVFEAGAGGGDGAVHLGGVGIGDGGEEFAGGGIADVDHGGRHRPRVTQLLMQRLHAKLDG